MTIDFAGVVVQDGKAAGQSVPHLHFHLLPRKLHGDRFATNNDEVYPALERAEGALPNELQSVAGASSPSDTQSAGAPESPRESGGGLVEGGVPLQMDADDDRKPRTMEEMVQEAEWLKGFFTDVEETQS